MKTNVNISISKWFHEEVGMSSAIVSQVIHLKGRLHVRRVTRL